MLRANSANELRNLEKNENTPLEKGGVFFYFFGFKMELLLSEEERGREEENEEIKKRGEEKRRSLLTFSEKIGERARFSSPTGYLHNYNNW